MAAMKKREQDGEQNQDTTAPISKSRRENAKKIVSEMKRRFTRESKKTREEMHEGEGKVLVQSIQAPEWGHKAINEWRPTRKNRSSKYGKIRYNLNRSHEGLNYPKLYNRGHHPLIHLPRFQPENLEKNKTIFERVNEMAAKMGCTLSQLALALIHHQGNDVYPILGTMKIGNLNQNIGALSMKLTPQEMTKLESFATADAVQGDRYASDIST
ncbi:hypothetical protein PIB30_090052 [Stylosanthes scabra]|uniref:NADP-dependent oxidoreductase domain-containing protein n=1 Tax=Stylosanthes scabra TaxID=79078 RepID=A0ABU6XTH6_9FABA|nr:hypothetical protein [Stylosanthes scabra]